MIKIIADGGHAAVVRDVAIRFGEGWGHMSMVAVGDNAGRKKEVESRPDESWSAYIDHPASYIAPKVEIGNGTVIMAGAIVQPFVKIGRHCILNTNSVTEHHCTIGDYAHIAPGAVLCGGVTVGEGALIGAGAVCVPGAVIPPWSLVKAGSVAK